MHMCSLTKEFRDCISLAQALIRTDTMTPASGERALLKRIGAVLEQAGFTVTLDAYDPDNPARCSLVASLNPNDTHPALLLGGHIDTVKAGNTPWQHAPLSGEIIDAKLHGRGSCDMKGGIAALLCAAVHMAPRLGKRNLLLHLYGGEEEGCRGSFHVMRTPALFKNTGAIVIAEPSGCIPLVGHKGALWVSLKTQGKTAHAAMPEQGYNALERLIPAASRLLSFHPEAHHPWLGACTSVLSTLHSGLNSNSVPDLATMTLDVRTVPGQDHNALRSEILSLAGPEVTVETTFDIPPVWTDPDHPWIGRLLDLFAIERGERPHVGTVQFFTDAAALRMALPDTPILILGPGDPTLAHQTDEACELTQLQTAEQYYEIIIRDWYALN